MINKDSIVTAYDEHLTLVEWLQKVEKALDNAVLTNLGIAKLSDQDNVATYRVTATFADNTTIVSDTFTLPSTDIVTAFSNLTTLVNGFDTRITDNTNNIARALFTPSSAPSTRKVVTIDTNGTQDNVDGTELTTLMENIVDSHGHKRFVEWNLTTSSIEGITFNYAKASLSGTHLMVVLAGKMLMGDYVNGRLASINLPLYIAQKIHPLVGAVAEYKDIPAYSRDYQLQTFKTTLFINETTLSVSLTNPFTNTADRTFRIQFDLLIDSD